MNEIRASMVEATDGVDQRSSSKIASGHDAELFTKAQFEMINFAQIEAKIAIRSGFFRLKLSFFTKLHSIGYSSIGPSAGQIRDKNVYISNSSLKAPIPSEILPLLDDMCDYINDNWKLYSAIHLAAYAMWRFLWIHPFTDGNGSVARIGSYYVMQARVGKLIPGKITIFQLLVDRRQEYYEALSDADMFWDRGELNLTKLEVLLSALLEEQIASAITSSV
jgi:Fic family protein